MDGKNLQQRLLGVRAQIPALTKQKYNEEVSYDFTRIDDIYKYLTPAMNREGVVMDVVSERATRKDAGGNPLYVFRLGDSGLWMYEADLTIVWRNADNPEDREEVILHAIGTNEMPDKAKGSAWTYLLKYYFFQKFAINQGGEDPDMNPGLKKEGTGKVPAGINPREEGECREGKNGTQPKKAETTIPSGQQGTGVILTVEDARKVKCGIGYNRGKTMGQIADDPVNGRQSLEWFANSYRGKNDSYRQAAGILLQAMQEECLDAA